MGARALADSLVRATRSLGDSQLRSQYVASIAREWPVDLLACALDAICERAEQAESPSRETLVAVVDALNAEPGGELVGRLREQAAAQSLLSLERLIRNPMRGAGGPATALEPAEQPNEKATAQRALARGGGRSLTLGERKWLARRPDRETMRRLLADPHPDVIRRCLGNPRITEDDVLPLAAKRPGQPEVLSEIARSRWVHRPRVRLALVLNPATPLEITARMAGLLLRPELQRVARSPGVAPAVRALCLEHLARRPPVDGRTARGFH
jgi:hypothetical protein